MAKFRKKPVVIEAEQWVEDGPAVGVVRFSRDSNNDPCKHCGRNLRDDHGWISTLEGGHIVCPNDWIITGVKGEKYPIKNDIFLETYERVEEN